MLTQRSHHKETRQCVCFVCKLYWNLRGFLVSVPFSLMVFVHLPVSSSLLFRSCRTCLSFQPSQVFVIMFRWCLDLFSILVSCHLSVHRPVKAVVFCSPLHPLPEVRFCCLVSISFEKINLLLILPASLHAQPAHAFDYNISRIMSK